MTIALQFCGAARRVTGTKHLLKVGDRRVLLDCGIVQGPRKVSDEANRKLPFHPDQIDAVVLSHAHIDHSGLLPKLVKDGFRGRITCTRATADLTSVLLRDAADIQVNDSRHLARRGQIVQPLYDENDVARTLPLLRGVKYHERVPVIPGVDVEFFDAGHILGSAIVLLHIDDGRQRLRLAFTGDHGRKFLPILRDPEPIPECDVLLTESTYGDREHPPRGDIETQVVEIVRREVEDGGRILVPAFSVGRTQNIVLSLGRLMHEGRIPRLPIFVDSPLSREATKVIAAHPELFDQETRALLATGRSPFYFEGVRYVADVEESKSLNELREGVIIAASGMCESGRILHHLARSVGRSQDAVVLIGYQAEATLGRKLQDGWQRVRIYGDEHAVRCKVYSLGGMSAHADWQEMLKNNGAAGRTARQTFVVHGEERPALAYAQRLTDAGFKNVVVPELLQEHVLA
jgi:metallo-beta-lactamase family protein